MQYKKLQKILILYAQWCFALMDSDLDSWILKFLNPTISIVQIKVECVGHSSIRFFQKLKIENCIQFSTFQFVNIYKNKFQTLIFVFL